MATTGCFERLFTILLSLAHLPGDGAYLQHGTSEQIDSRAHVQGSQEQIAGVGGTRWTAPIHEGTIWAPSPCAGSFERCGGSGAYSGATACCDAAESCFRKDSGYAQCRARCPLPKLSDGSVWKCHDSSNAAARQAKSQAKAATAPVKAARQAKSQTGWTSSSNVNAKQCGAGEYPLQRHPCFGMTGERQCDHNDDVASEARRASSGGQHFVFIGGLQRSGTTSAKASVLQLLGAAASGMVDSRQIRSKTDTLKVGGRGGLEGKFVQGVYPRAFWLADRLAGCNPSLVRGVDQCARDMNRCTWGSHGGAPASPLAELKRDWEHWWVDRRASVLVEKTPENILLAPALQAIFRETSHFIVLTRHPLPWALALDTFPRTRRAPLERRFSAWLEAAELMAENGKRLSSWSWVPYELIGEPGVLVSTLRALLPHAELSRAGPLEPELAAQLRSSNERYARCWGLGVRLGSFEFALSNSSECATQQKSENGLEGSPSLNRDVLRRAASLYECHISSFGYTLTLGRSGNVDTRFQPDLVRPSALIEAMQRNLPSAPRRAPPRSDVIVLKMYNQTGCTAGLDCREDGQPMLGMALREAQIVAQLQSQGFRVHLVGGASAFSWIERMEGCLRWRLRAIVALHTVLGMVTRKHFAYVTDWTNLPIATQQDCASCSQRVHTLVGQYPGQLLDMAINKLKAITRDWTLVAVTDDIHYHRIWDAARKDALHTPDMQKWLWRRERHIYSAADSVLVISEQDGQTIAGLLGENHSQAIHVFPYAPDVVTSNHDAISFDDRSGGILYVGSNHPVARRSVEWFIEQVLPIISRGLQSRGVSCCNSCSLFTLVGQGWDKMHVGQDQSLVAVRDRVPQAELELMYSKAKVCVAPQHMERPSGIATKVINAIARGLPVVTTSLVDVGLPPSSAGQHPVRVAQDASGFALHVLELLSNVSAWSAQQRAGSTFLDRQDIGHAQSSALRLALTSPRRNRLRNEYIDHGGSGNSSSDSLIGRPLDTSWALSKPLDLGAVPRQPGSSDCSTLVVSAHHKTGTMLAHAVITLLCGKKPEVLDVSDDYGGEKVAKCGRDGRGVRTWCQLRHARANQAATVLASGRLLVHFIRDPLEQVVSAYQYHLVSTTEKWLQETGLQARLRNASPEVGLEMQWKQSSGALTEVREAYKEVKASGTAAQTFTVRFQDAVGSEASLVAALGHWLGIERTVSANSSNFSTNSRHLQHISDPTAKERLREIVMRQHGPEINAIRSELDFLPKSEESTPLGNLAATQEKLPTPNERLHPSRSRATVVDPSATSHASQKKFRSGVVDPNATSHACMRGPSASDVSVDCFVFASQSGRLAYIKNAKAASTMMTSTMSRVWADASWAKWSSLEKPQDFTFFTTAREPIERLRSAYAEIETRWLSNYGGPPTSVNATYWSMQRSDMLRFEAFLDDLAAGRLNGARNDIGHALRPRVFTVGALPNLRVLHLECIDLEWQALLTELGFSSAIRREASLNVIHSHSSHGRRLSAKVEMKGSHHLNEIAHSLNTTTTRNRAAALGVRLTEAHGAHEKAMKTLQSTGMFLAALRKACAWVEVEAGCFAYPLPLECHARIDTDLYFWRADYNVSRHPLCKQQLEKPRAGNEGSGGLQTPAVGGKPASAVASAAVASAVSAAVASAAVASAAESTHTGTRLRRHLNL